MPQIMVNAYDDRHPEHAEMMTLCGNGLDISLLPTFEIEIEVPDANNGLLAGQPL